jgi:D-glycero-D-manno-heptose 1,7-bisphosphate phosphatase
VPTPESNTFSSDLSTVFLDRDGVLNEKMPEGCYVTRWEDFHPLPGVPGAIRQLNLAGLRVIVVSNQRGVSLGLYSVADVAAIHARFQQLLAENGAYVDAFYFCPHAKHSCTCRKPLSGLFDQAKAEFPAIAPANSVMIGDSRSDIEFGHRLGMKTVFIDGNPTHQKPGSSAARELADLTRSSLSDAVHSLLASRS